MTELVTVLIPARLASTRLPNKPLADIAGLPMVVRVAQRVSAGMPPSTRVVVAGDSPLISEACLAHGVECLLTRSDHPSGSDRLAEGCELLGLQDQDIVVNVQGDEPLIDVRLVSKVARLLRQTPQASMSTAAHPIQSIADFLNPNVVKVVINANGLALYFSRAPIPHWRDQPPSPEGLLCSPLPLRHSGIYGYRAGFLRQFPELSPSPLEMLEALEQLRALWHGHHIAVHVSSVNPGRGVDTAQDLEHVRRLFAA